MRLLLEHSYETDCNSSRRINAGLHDHGARGNCPNYRDAAPRGPGMRSLRSDGQRNRVIKRKLDHCSCRNLHSFPLRISLRHLAGNNANTGAPGRS